MKLTPYDLQEMNLLKYYRLIRKWACKTYGLKDADFTLRVMILLKAYILIHGIKTDGSDYVETVG